MKKLLFYFMAVIQFAFSVSCASSTRITASWKNPEVSITPTNESQSVFVAALIRNMEVRTKLENELAEEAARRNIKAVKGTTVFPPDFYQKLPSEDALMSRIRQADVDAILTVSLIDKESESRYVPRSGFGYAPYPTYRWYGGFYPYYNYWFPIIYDPGYYVTDKTYFLETNLYDAENGNLIWSAQSETVNPVSIDNFVNDYPKKLVQRMIEDGLLKK